MPGKVRARAKKINRIMRERRPTYQTVTSASSGFKRVTRRQIHAVARKIVDEFSPEKVILFGSYAYGKPTIDSDVDLLVVMDSNERPSVRISKVVGALEGVKTFSMDILVRTPQELEHRLAIGDFFIQEILQRGKVLYARLSV